MKKKRYEKPVITVVKLDPEQALLAQCEEGGAYFRADEYGCLPPDVRCPYGITGDCMIAPKGSSTDPWTWFHELPPENDMLS